MKQVTKSLIERPYQEIVDDLLTSMIGGVVNEPIIFDVQLDLYPLAEPASDIRGITGIKDAGRFTFQKNIDFAFSEGDNAVVWQEGAARPDDLSVFFVDYARRSAEPPLTDINIGSVTRTITEAIGREIAMVYQQINLAYQSGFIDTATGKSLDLVVAILGVKRKNGDYARGLVTFFRDPTDLNNITIAEGTRLTTQKGDVFFETTELRTLQRGQVRIDVPVQAAEDFKGPVGKVAASAITVMSQPIEGISKIQNFEPTALGAAPESDEELRTRAKAKLRALGKGTLAALHEIILADTGEEADVWDPNNALAKRSAPGTVLFTVSAEPERLVSLQGRIHEARAAGVQVTLIAKYVFVKPRIVARIKADETAEGKLKVISQIIEALAKYVDALTRGQAAIGADMLKACQDLEDIKPFKDDLKFVDVITWKADIGSPAEQTLVDRLLVAIQTAPAGDADALRTTLSRVVTDTAPLTLPTGRRVPDRDLVRNAADTARATDQDIEKGTFKVTATVDGEPWWIALDIEQADIMLVEG